MRFGKIIASQPIRFDRTRVRPPNACFVSARRRSMSAFSLRWPAHRNGLAAFGRDFGDDSVSARLAGSVVDDHDRAHFGQVLGDSGADAFGRARRGRLCRRVLEIVCSWLYLLGLNVAKSEIGAKQVFHK
jgi:hypothetical protein